MAQSTGISSYRDLQVWQKGMDLVVESYRLTEQLPKAELYGLVSQIRRATLSIPANIAEGHAPDLTCEFLPPLTFSKDTLMVIDGEFVSAPRMRLIPCAKA